MPKPSWKNRIIGYENVPIDQVLYNARNYRVHPKAQQAALSGVLSDVGVVQNIIINRTTGNLVDGHLRVMLADRNGETHLPATIVELSEAEECEILATFDPLSAMATADREKLDALLRDVHTGEAAVMEMLSKLAETNELVPPDMSEVAAGVKECNECPQCGYRWYV
jgi:hypothetical protein